MTISWIPAKAGMTKAMQVTALKTHKITTEDNDILKVLDTYITTLQEKSVVVIASKIVAICQGRVKSLTEEEKDNLIKKEADLYIPKEENTYGLYVTIKNNYLTYSSGIDESNTKGGFVLWPKDPQLCANTIREYLSKKFHLAKLGVIITDMAAIPLQKGLIAGAIAYSGFVAFKDITGSADVFGREFKYSWEGHLQGLAAAAGVVMGEGAQQTPLGIITDIPFVEFVNRNPTEKELESMHMDIDSDMYGCMIKSVKWQKGTSS
jgi:dihydrofolate synthase / folylpolyglutamate synthase